MKKIIAWPLVWIFYGLGHFTSRVLMYPKWMGWLYPVYNFCMNRSFNLEQWAGSEFIWGETLD